MSTDSDRYSNVGASQKTGMFNFVLNTAFATAWFVFGFSPKP